MKTVQSALVVISVLTLLNTPFRAAHSEIIPPAPLPTDLLLECNVRITHVPTVVSQDIIQTARVYVRFFKVDLPLDGGSSEHELVAVEVSGNSLIQKTFSNFFDNKSTADKYILSTWEFNTYTDDGWRLELNRTTGFLSGWFTQVNKTNVSASNRTEYEGYCEKAKSNKKKF